MKKGSSIIKLVIGLVVVAVVVVGVVFIAKGKGPVQGASLYRATDLKAGAAGALTPVNGSGATALNNLLPCSTGNSTKVIKVFSPNGGETFNAGQTITARWGTCNLPSTDTMKVMVGYFGPGSMNPTTAQTATITTNTGSVTFTLPAIPNFQVASLQSGNYYKIVVVDSNTSPTVADWSDSTFTIMGSNSTFTNDLLSINRDAQDLNDHSVAGSASSNTNGIQLAMIDADAQGGAIMIKKFPVTLTVGGGATNPSDIVNTLKLYYGGNLIDSQAVPAGMGSKVVTFQNLNVNIAQNTTAVFTVKGDFNAVGGTGFPNGSSAEVDVTSINTAAIQAYDSNNNPLTGVTHLTGSTMGGRVSMYVNGILVSPQGIPTITVSAPGGSQPHSMVTYRIPFSVTAFGAPAYIPNGAQPSVSASATNKIQFCIDATTACAAAGTGIISYTGGNTVIPTAHDNYQIPVGQTQNFELIATYMPSSPIMTRASLLNVNWANSDLSGTSGWSTYTAGLNTNSFKTPYAAAQ